MNASPPLLIVGASTRAAAFSALRAGLRPWCADLFADADLRARCPVTRVPPAEYPQNLFDAARGAPAGPWMYTGAVENRPTLVQQLANARPLWGNGADVLTRVRSPRFLARLFKQAGIPCPELGSGRGVPDAGKRWLLKPRRGAGGSGVRFWTGGPARPAASQYLQEYIMGEPRAAVYVGAGGQTRLLGLTRQLVGEPWLHAAPFRYCGSIGPLAGSDGLQAELHRLGQVLGMATGVRGVFGVDLIVRGGQAWPVEVNPRYSASVEVHEYATGLPALAWHRWAFDPSAPEPPSAPCPGPRSVIGKAILFARRDLVFPADGPWLATLRQPAPVENMPAFADIPAAGEPIPAGRPVLTFFAAASEPADCLDALKRTARDLDRWLART